jgi:hypothetical protein
MNTVADHFAATAARREAVNVPDRITVTGWVWIVWNAQGTRLGAGITTQDRGVAENNVARFRNDYGTDIQWQIIPFSHGLIDPEAILAATR